MVRASQLLARQFIDRAGQSLGDAAAVDEDDGGMALADDLHQAGMNGGPDGCPLWALGGRTTRQFLPLAHARHVFYGNFNAQVELLGLAGVDDGDRAVRDHGLLIQLGGCFGAGGRSAEEMRDLFQRALGGGEADALHTSLCDGLEPLER